MNSNTTNNSWTSWSFMSGLTFFAVGLLIALFNYACDLPRLQAELKEAPMYFGSETMVLQGHSQLQFQYKASNR